MLEIKHKTMKKTFKLNHFQEIGLICLASFICVVGVFIAVAYAQQIDDFLFNLVTKLSK